MKLVDRYFLTAFSPFHLHVPFYIILPVYSSFFFYKKNLGYIL